MFLNPLMVQGPRHTLVSIHVLQYAMREGVSDLGNFAYGRGGLEILINLFVTLN